MSAGDRVTKSFTTTINNPIVTSHSRPSYTSLHIAQSELNGNAASVHTNLGRCLHGHLALTISAAAEYLALSNNIEFIPPETLLPTLCIPRELQR
jgi:hypothetical protein